MELHVRLTGAGTEKGEAELEIESEDRGQKIEFEVQVESATPGSIHDVILDGIAVGQITIDAGGKGRLRLSSDESHGQPLPGDFPTAGPGSNVQVGTILSGTLGVDGPANQDDDSSQDDRQDDVSGSGSSTHLASSLTGLGREHGETEFESEGDDRGPELQFEVEVEDAVPGTVHDVAIDGVVVAQLTVDALGRGRVRLSSKLEEPGDLPIPDNFPANVGPSSVVTVGTIVSGSLSLRGDLNDDHSVDADDVDMLFAAIRTGSSDSRHDLDRNKSVNSDDAQFLVSNLIGTVFGDANLDGVFDSSDLIQVFQSGRYEDSGPDDSKWESGDWNGDGRFDSGDIVLAFKTGKYSE